MEHRQEVANASERSLPVLQLVDRPANGGPYVSNEPWAGFVLAVVKRFWPGTSGWDLSASGNWA